MIECTVLFRKSGLNRSFLEVGFKWKCTVKIYLKGSVRLWPHSFSQDTL